MKKILIVDDELLIRDLLYDHFSSHDYHISMADSGQKALDILNSDEVDCILTDLKMPDMDGLELIRKAREQSEKKVPVILITGFPSIESAVDALRSRVDDYIVKPFNIKRLHDSVEKAIADASGNESTWER
jgi:DNA-binding response OmpR family regulator